MFMHVFMGRNVKNAYITKPMDQLSLEEENAI